jgi:hypothetical protein
VIVSAGSENHLCVWNPDGKLLSEIQFGADINDLAFRRGWILVSNSEHRLHALPEKAVKLFLKFISHYSRGGRIVLPSGLGMLVHVLIRSLAATSGTLRFSYRSLILTAFQAVVNPTVDLG